MTSFSQVAAKPTTTQATITTGTAQKRFVSSSSTMANSFYSDKFQSFSENSDSESSSGSSANEEIVNYDDSIEPVPTEEEAAAYLEQLTLEEEEEQTLLSRFSGENDLTDWYVAALFTVFLQQVCFASVMLENPPQFCP